MDFGLVNQERVRDIAWQAGRTSTMLKGNIHTRIQTWNTGTLTARHTTCVFKLEIRHTDRHTTTRRRLLPDPVSYDKIQMENPKIRLLLHSVSNASGKLGYSPVSRWYYCVQQSFKKHGSFGFVVAPKTKQKAERKPDAKDEQEFLALFYFPIYGWRMMHRHLWKAAAQWNQTDCLGNLSLCVLRKTAAPIAFQWTLQTIAAMPPLGLISCTHNNQCIDTYFGCTYKGLTWPDIALVSIHAMRMGMKWLRDKQNKKGSSTWMVPVRDGLFIITGSSVSGQAVFWKAFSVQTNAFSLTNHLFLGAWRPHLHRSWRNDVAPKTCTASFATCQSSSRSILD